MHDVDFDTLRARFFRLWRETVFLHSTVKRLAEKYPDGVFAALDSDQEQAIHGLCTAMLAIDKQTRVLMGFNEEPKHEQAEPGK